MRIHLPCILLSGTILGTSCLPAQQQTPVPPAAPVMNAISDQEIAEAYFYLLGRILILRQQRMDFEKGGFEWNKIVHHESAGADSTNPNLDMICSEAWIAVDDQNCVVVDIPKITGRYFTCHLLNGWGETVLNINERTFPQQPFGRYALCLKGSNPKIPKGAMRVDLPCKTVRMLARMEQGTDAKETLKLQKQFKLTPSGTIRTEKPLEVPLFGNDQLPGVEAFDQLSEITRESELNERMKGMRARISPIEALTKSSAEGRARVDKVIREQALPKLKEPIEKTSAPLNGWFRANTLQQGSNDCCLRAATNLTGIWPNQVEEVASFTTLNLDGGATYLLTFPANALPTEKGRFFWSIAATGAQSPHVIPNPANRHLLHKYSKIDPNSGGSMTLVFSPQQPKYVPPGNWLPTLPGQPYQLTLRLYGPSNDVTDGSYCPPALDKRE